MSKLDPVVYRDTSSAMFRDRLEVPDNLQLPKPQSTQLVAPVVGKRCKLLTNCFSLNLKEGAAIYHYSVSMTPAAKSLKEEEWVMHKIWADLAKLFNGVFVVRSPGHVFTPIVAKAANAKFSVEADKEKGYERHEVGIHFADAITADQVNSGKLGVAGVVFQHVAKKLAGQLGYQRVGRRYFDDKDIVRETKTQLMVFSSFYAGMQSLSSCGPLLQIDTLQRIALQRNIIESITSTLDTGHPMQLDNDEVLAEWRRRCAGATVVTLYNNKLYRIKEVDFSMTPMSTFIQTRREHKTEKDMSFQHYYATYYEKEIIELRQPLLVAFPEKDSEKVYLVPELCALTGFTDEMSKDKQMFSAAMKQAKVAPAERLKAICALASSMETPDVKNEQTQGVASEFLQDWNLTLNKEPATIEGQVHDPLEVNFGSGEKRYTIEEGNFQRWMRNGLQRPARVDDWLFIYPESDVPVLDIWLRSLRDVAQVAFAMKMADPTRVICSEQRRDIVQLLESRLTPKTQLVLLLVPTKDSKKIYELFKTTTISSHPCITQVVRSETIRKRQSIAAILSRIVLQINAKFCGPLWYVDLESPITAPLMTVPTMVIGLDVFHSYEGESVETYLGFAASLDSACATYFSRASVLDKQDWRMSISEKIQEFTREAILHFTRRNEKSLPEHFIIYRASASEDQWPAIRETEVGAFQQFFDSCSDLDLVRCSRIDEPETELPVVKYTPDMTFVAISKNTHMRFFASSPDATVGTKNPDPGTIIDGPLTARSDVINFYLVNQAASKGTAKPSHYTVLHDTANVQPLALQSLTYRLSFLYYNFTGSVKMPAPAQYAKKIAHMIGTAVRTDPHKRLACSFFYL